MEPGLGKRVFLKRALAALAAYTLLSGLTYFAEGTLTHWFFNPAVNNLLIGSFVLFAFTVSARKRLQGLPTFPMEKIWALACALLAGLLLFARMGLTEGSLTRKAVSTLAGLLLMFGFLGPKLSLYLAKNFSQHIIPSILCFYIVDYVFAWKFLAAPVLSIVVSVLKGIGVPAYLELNAVPPFLNVFNVSVKAVEETSGVEALILYTIGFLGLAALEGGSARLRQLLKPYFLGLAGAFVLVAGRLLGLIGLYAFLDLDFVNVLALNPLNQLAFLAYTVWCWRKAGLGRPSPPKGTFGQGTA